MAESDAARGAGRPALVEVMGCAFAPSLHYDVRNHIWADPLPDGTIRLGLTRVAIALASDRIFAFTPKRVGREIEAGAAFATIESSKWVGPARSPFDGVVTRINEELIDRPALLVQFPYDRAWMIEARPARSESLRHLVTGADAIRSAYSAWMHDNDFPGCGTTTP